MESSTSGPVLYCAFAACIGAYWPMFRATGWAFRRFFPDFYDRLENEDKTKKLVPVIMMIVRVILGISISLPSCAYAGYMTPAGLNQPLSVAGQICIASQTTVWATEINIVMQYSNELFVHHLMCLLITSCIVLSPSLHQVKPLYIYFSAQMGDLGPAAIILTKMTGRTPANSKLLYHIALASTTWLIFGKCGVTGASLGLVLQNPYRISDWLWAICLSFYGIYSLYGAYRNLKWMGIVKHDERFHGVIFMNTFRVYASQLWLGIAFGATLVSTLFVYSLYSPRQITRGEISTVAIQGLIAASIGLTSAIIIHLGCQTLSLWTDTDRKDLSLQYGLICAAGWISWASSVSNSMDEPTILAAVAFNIPLFEAITRVGHYYSAKDQSRHSGNGAYLMNGNHKPQPLLVKSMDLRIIMSGTASIVSMPNEKKQLSRFEEALLEKSTAYENIEESRLTGTSLGSTTSQENFSDELSIDENSIDEQLLNKPANIVIQELAFDPAIVNRHYRMIYANLWVYFLSVGCLFGDVFSLSDVATLSVAASVLAQLFQRPGMIPATLRGACTPVVLYVLLTHGITVLEGCLSLYALFAVSIRALSYSQVALKVVVLTCSLTAGRSMEYLLQTNREDKKAAGEGPKKKARSIILSMILNKWTFVIVMNLLVQVINTREVIRNPNYPPAEALPMGWRNFRTALTSPVTWTGAAYMVGLPIVGLGVLNL